MSIIYVTERKSFYTKLESQGYQIIVDPEKAAKYLQVIMNRAAFSRDSLTEGFYHFVTDPEVFNFEGTTYWKAKAAYFFKNEEGWFAHFDYYNVSHLISKLSYFKDHSGKIAQAHRIYEWPSPGLRGDKNEWAKKKVSFIKKSLIGSYVNVFESKYITTDPEYGPHYSVKWNFITASDFYNFPNSLQMTEEFSEFLLNKDQYPSLNTTTSIIAASAVIGTYDGYIEDIDFTEDYLIEDYFEEDSDDNYDVQDYDQFDEGSADYDEEYY